LSTSFVLLLQIV